MPASITPEQEMKVLKLILSLRDLGDAESSEKLRTKTRKTLLETTDETEAIEEMDSVIHRYTRLKEKLDGSLENRRELKRQKRELRIRQAARFVDDQAESGEEDASEGDEEEEVVNESKE